MEEYSLIANSGIQFYVKEIEFASEINISLDSPSDAMRRKKVLINGNSDFKIAPIPSPNRNTAAAALRQRWPGPEPE